MDSVKSAPSSQIEDYLDEDPEINGQKYALVSFISPENVLDKKDHFFFERFLQGYEVNWKVSNLEKFLAESVTTINDALSENVKKLEKEGQQEGADICRKAYIKIDDVLGRYQTFVAKNQKEVTRTKIVEDYNSFLFKEQKKLEEEFHAANKFRTSVRGLKVRGVVRDEREAQLRAKKLQATDKIHNIFLAEVGKWTPWDPAPSNIENQEYAQEELNALMKKYKENEASKDQFFEEQRKTRKEGAGPAVSGKVMELINSATDESSANTVLEPVASATTAATAAAQSSFGALFDGPGDLAIARKSGKSD